MDANIDVADSTGLLGNEASEEKYDHRATNFRVWRPQLTRVLTTMVVLLVVFSSILLFGHSRVPWFDKNTDMNPDRNYCKHIPSIIFTHVCQLMLVPVGTIPTIWTPFSHQWIGLERQELPNYRYKDEQWDGLFPSMFFHSPRAIKMTNERIAYGGIVALPSKFRTEHRLPENAALAPEEEDKKLYYIAGYHQLHCLVSLSSVVKH